MCGAVGRTQAAPTRRGARRMANRCPRCGQGPLFAGVLKLAPKCEECGLDYGPYDQGDGPAGLVVFIVGFVIVGAALVLEFTLHPPYLVHMIIWPPATIGLSILLLRPLKAWMVMQQYNLVGPIEHPSMGPSDHE